MANPNPNPATRFGAGQANGSRGRQKAARDKLSAAFLEALSDAFNEPNDEGGIKGLDAIKKVRDEDPATYAHLRCAHAKAGRDYGRGSNLQSDRRAT